MRHYLDRVEKNWRKIAMNKRSPVKIRKAALERMECPTDIFLCRLMKACKGHPSLEFLVTERLAEVRKDAEVEHNLRVGKKDEKPVSAPTILDL